MWQDKNEQSMFQEVSVKEGRTISDPALEFTPYSLPQDGYELPTQLSPIRLENKMFSMDPEGEAPVQHGV